MTSLWVWSIVVETADVSKKVYSLRRAGQRKQVTLLQVEDVIEAYRDTRSHLRFSPRYMLSNKHAWKCHISVLVIGMVSKIHGWITYFHTPEMTIVYDYRIVWTCL